MPTNIQGSIYYNLKFVLERPDKVVLFMSQSVGLYQLYRYVGRVFEAAVNRSERNVLSRHAKLTIPHKHSGANVCAKTFSLIL